MPPRAKWKRDGTSDSPKPLDLRLKGLEPDGRLQLTSGVLNRSAYETRKNVIRQAWTMGGIWSDAVRGLKLKRFDVAEFMAAWVLGEPGIRSLLERKGAESLVTLVRDYLKQTKASDKKKMRQRLQRFSAFLGKSPSVADLTPANVEAFLDALTDLRTANRKAPEKAKGSTANRYRSVIGGMCTWAVRAGRLQLHPIAGKKVEKRAEPHHRLPELSADEYREYMAKARAFRPDLAIIPLLLIHTAPDVGEVFTREARDVDFDTGRIRYQRTKTARFGVLPRYVPMPSVVIAEVRAHLAEHDLKGSQTLFGMFERSEVEWLHKRCVEAIARPELTLKDMRHVAAIAWVKAGVHIRLVSRWLGHTSLNMTMRYTDYEPDAEAATAMAERAAETLNRTADVTPIRAVR